MLYMLFQILFFEANHIFNDRIVKYEDKKKFEEILQKIYADNNLNYKYEGMKYEYRVIHLQFSVSVPILKYHSKLLVLNKIQNFRFIKLLNINILLY